MNDPAVAALRAEVNRGIDALKRRQADQASVHFTEALNLGEDIEDSRKRRDEIAVLSGVYVKCGFPDLALIAAEEAVQLDGELGLRTLRGEDLLSAGNAHVAMENMAKAEKCYRDALQTFLDENDLANAASANTNVANIVASRGNVADGISLLLKSLEYLADNPLPNTEMQTRFALLRMAERAQYDLARSVENAKLLWSRFVKDLHPQQREMTMQLVGQLADRYCKAHPEVNCDRWKADNFPQPR